ncbi:DUF4651 domain-containing protein [Streptococcus sp. X16XC17]|uniref:DUF4651 domain-containing protein n=1 Tax=unclassified Streptococcus TaxID=2608887 RepID=UPI00066FD71B|nr:MULTISPECIES: DUF4651 domain-containing protein [unclassified Streptococcus]TCD45519.1 DUF4651 domain-containing protein [Streptococcus sp. X16XC17]
MNKKKAAIVAGIVGTGILAASARFYMKAQEEVKKAQALAHVRRFFADFGTIATVFVYENDSNARQLTGGVVMEGGPVYLFDYQNGQIVYEEEEAADSRNS